MSDIEAAVHAALDAYGPTDEGDRERLVRALEAYHSTLHPTSVAGTAPFADGKTAARWLATTGGHPRYSGTLWPMLLDPGHDLSLALARVRSLRGAPPETTAWSREAERLILEEQERRASAREDSP